ncbi:MAG: cupin domain-containing protein [Chitinophaga sp.]|nr:cupin domain-containing protein [Chitinophaga sp.]
MKHLAISSLLFSLIILNSCSSRIFPEGEKITNSNFTGNTFLRPLIEADSLNQTSVGNVSFKQGSRTKWHYHPGGQILLALDGIGFYQEKGKAKQILKKGDVVKCPPNMPHWHGASPKKSFVQVAITNNSKGPTVWLDEVTSEVYNN